MKVFLRTYGCRANHYDTEQIKALLAENDVDVVGGEDDADVAIFNSCSVTAGAEADLRQGIRRATRRNPRIRNVITGCAAGRVLESGVTDELLALPNVDNVVGPADLDDLADALDIRRPAPHSPSRTQSAARALLRIQDGCDEHCTFCITTIARGNNRSRREGEILSEARTLAESHPEIVLTGTHIGSYGVDAGTCLSELVAKLIAAVPGTRFRLSSLEATEVDDRLAALFADSGGALTPYLHAPLQSGSDSLLKRMGRHWYRARDYQTRIEAIIGDAVVFGLGADIITGFPGETDADHRATVALVETLPFTALHVFPFSERAGTAALRMSGAVDPALSRVRAAELRGVGELKLAGYLERRVHHPADIVVVQGSSGITEDLLAVTVSSAHRRSERFSARLERKGGKLHTVQH